MESAEEIDVVVRPALVSIRVPGRYKLVSSKHAGWVVSGGRKVMHVQ